MIIRDADVSLDIALDKIPAAVRNSLDMEFLWIPAGEFRMGSADEEDDERPVHTVRISRPFYLGKYEVTQAQWKAVMGNNPSYFKGDNLPVENVSWEDVQEFIWGILQPFLEWPPPIWKRRTPIMTDQELKARRTLLEEELGETFFKVLGNTLGKYFAQLRPQFSSG